MWNYTETPTGIPVEVVRGSRWPPGDDDLSIKLIKSSGWPAAAHDGTWTWTLSFHQELKGGTPDMVLTSITASLDGVDLVLTFRALPADTAALSGEARKKFYVDLESNDGGAGGGVDSYYDQAQGYAWVRDWAGPG